MTKSNTTEIVVIMDRSGSMNKIKSDMEGGFNSFIEEQKKLPGECLVTLVQFDHGYDVVYERKLVSEVEPMKLLPGGSTALLGALGKTIDDVGRRLSEMNETDRPGQVLFVVITDGEENCSQNNSWSSVYTKDVVFQMVKHQTEVYNWQFVYLGANQDAFKEGGSMGITNSFNYTASAAGTQDMLRSVTTGVTNYRNSGKYTLS